MKYEEIINHPHYEPKKHPRMSREMRAGQFAPFAALSGHASAVRRTAKFAELREQRIIESNLDDERFDIMEL
ncbi:hypothetical protein IKF32_00650 [Candidatus Saccharibacteria bacterium]|nr:hypothetical protein [Candidatus Saccharibacteria bacterium]